MTGAQQCFVVFDVLMVNDTNLANCPLKERAEQLKKYIGYEFLIVRCQLTLASVIILQDLPAYKGMHSLGGSARS